MLAPIQRSTIISAKPSTTTPQTDSPIERSLEKDAHIIGIINQKGGVGKTTTAINLSAALTNISNAAGDKQRVLLVDLDPQANTTSGIGISSPEEGSYEWLVGELPSKELVQKTSVKNLFLMPAAGDLSAVGLELKAEAQTLVLLKNRLEALRRYFDVIILDAPPSLGLLTLNILIATDSLIIPLQAEYYALEGLASLMDTVERVRSSYNAKLEILGVLITMFDSRTKLAQEVESNARNHLGEKVFWTVIPRSIRLAEAPSYGKSILQYAAKSNGATSYRRLAEEVMQRVKQQKV